VQASSPASPTLLLVDDDPFMLAVLADLLAPEGYRLLAAASGEEALAILAREQVEVILCDQRMPSMSGTEFMALAAKGHPRTVRLILSGQAQDGEVARAIAAGEVDAYYTKPWSGTALREQLRAAFLLQRERERECDRR
jgi:two-component system cell cycle response regulator